MHPVIAVESDCILYGQICMDISSNLHHFRMGAILCKLRFPQNQQCAPHSAHILEEGSSLRMSDWHSLKSLQRLANAAQHLYI